MHQVTHMNETCHTYTQVKSRIWISHQERSQNYFENLMLPDGITEFSVVPICSHSFDSIGFVATKSGVRCTAIGQMDSTGWERTNSRQIMSASIAQAFVCELGENILKLRKLYSRKLQSYSHHSYGPTVNQLGPGAGRMFKAFWDRSVSCHTWVTHENESRQAF